MVFRTMCTITKGVCAVLKFIDDTAHLHLAAGRPC